LLGFDWNHFEMADLALTIQTGISAIALLGVGWTVHYSRRTWLEARRSADIAREALEKSRKEAEAHDLARIEQLQLMARQAGAMSEIAQNSWRA
jgi:hypothetical protein